MELKAIQLTKQYGSKTAVNHLNLSLSNGVYGLLGANGAGKTTLMRLLCDIQTPTSTHIVSDVEFIAEDIIMMKDGQILHFGKTQEITTEIDGQVWECTVPTSRAEQYSETLNISNLRNIENNCTVLRVISEQSPMENAIKVEPTLEDLYKIMEVVR